MDPGQDRIGGVDVSKDKLDVFVDSVGEAFAVDNKAAGVADTADRSGVARWT